MDFIYAGINNVDFLADQICQEANTLAGEVRGISEDPKSSSHRKVIEQFNSLRARVSELSERVKEGDKLSPSSLKKLQARLVKIDRQIKSQKIRQVVGSVALKQLAECQSKVKQLLSPENRLLWANEAAARQQKQMEPKEVGATSQGGQSGPKSWLLHGLLFLGSMGWLPRIPPSPQRSSEVDKGSSSTQLVVAQTADSSVSAKLIAPVVPDSQVSVIKPTALIEEEFAGNELVSMEGLEELVKWLNDYERLRQETGLSEEQREYHLLLTKTRIKAVAQVLQIESSVLLDLLPGFLLVPLLQRERAELVKILLDCGISPNGKDTSGTPILHLAMQVTDKEERRQIVEAFVEAGSKINARNAKGQTATELLLNLYRQSPNKQDAQLLLVLYMAGAKFSKQHLAEIFDLALKVGDPDTLKNLLEHIDVQSVESLQKQGVAVAAEFVKRADDQEGLLMTLVHKGLNVTQLDEMGRSALYHACRLHKPRLARALWMQGATLSIKERSLLMKTKGDLIPLWSSQFKFPYVAPKTPASFRPVSKRHREAIKEAVKNNRFTDLSLLMEGGLDTECLQEALKKKNEKAALMMVFKLVENGQSLDMPGEAGNTVVHTAVKNGQVKALEAILLAGANVDSVNEAGLKPSEVVTEPKPAPEAIKCLQLLAEAGASSSLKGYPLSITLPFVYPEIPSISSVQAAISYKTLGHAFEIAQPLEFRGRYIPLEGGTPPLFSSEMAEAFEELQVKYPTLFSKDEAREMASILKLGSTSRVAKDFIEDIQRNVTVSIHTGFFGHAIEVLLYKNQYLIVSNKGWGKPITAYRIDPDKVTEKTIGNIIQMSQGTPEAYVAWFNQLGRELGAEQDPLTRAVSSAYPLFPYQNIGNCAWEGVETSIYALIAMDRFSKYDFSVACPDSEAIESVKQTFVNWLKFTQLYVLEKHLTLYEQEHVSYEEVPINHQIMQSVFRKARLSPSTLVGLDDWLNQLEGSYLDLTQKSHAESEKLNFKINRIWDKTVTLQEPHEDHLNQRILVVSVLNRHG